MPVLNFGPEDIFEDREAMLWIRYFPVDKRKLGNRKIIHGHTPRPLEEVVNPESEDVFNIDSGCVYRDRPGHGYLTAINLTDREWMAVKNCEVIIGCRLSLSNVYPKSIPIYPISCILVHQSKSPLYEDQHPEITVP